MSGVIYCFSGPSGSGKTTLADVFRRTSNGTASRITTVTTRGPRPGEIDGVDYHFWEEPVFERAIRDDLFFEYEMVHGNFYGTLKGSLEDVIAKNEVGVIILDVNGALKLKDTFPENTINVFLTCTMKAELRRRIEERKSPPQEIERRLRNASAEVQTYSRYREKFDYLIVNDDLNIAAAALANITIHEAVKRGRSLTFKDDAYE